MKSRHLFKAKRINSDEWVEGFLFLMGSDCTPTYSKYCIGVEPLWANDSEINECCYAEVDPDTILYIG